MRLLCNGEIIVAEVFFCTESLVGDDQITYTVIAARFQGQWLFCRRKDCSAWDIPWGYREIGESIEATARRKLYEIVGSSDADVRRIGVYRVSHGEVITVGMLFFAEIKAMDRTSLNSEIGDICLFNALPDQLTYPSVQSYLYSLVQDWLNLQTNAGELWDVYDENRVLTGRLHRRGDFLPSGDYHLSVHIWILNSHGEFLLTKRSPNKGFPNMWEATGGAALAGDDSLTAAIREVREETGLELAPEKGECVISYRGKDHFTDVWLFKQDFNIADVQLLEGETCDKMLADMKTVLQLKEKGMLVPFHYLNKLVQLVEEHRC